MSGTFPSTQGLRGLNFTNAQPNLLTVAVSGRRQAKSQGAQAFSFTAQTPPMSTAEYKETMGFLAAQQGQYGSFQIVLPNISTPAGSVSGNVLDVVGAHTAGDKTIAVDGGTASQTGYLKKGVSDEEQARMTQAEKFYEGLMDEGRPTGFSPRKIIGELDSKTISR